MSFEFTFTMGIRGYHVYQASWTPSHEDKLTFVQEKDLNKYDPCAVAVKGTFKENIAPIVIGHVPVEISRYVYHSLSRNCRYTIKVCDRKPYRSPLTQGGLEVRCSVTAFWENEEWLGILKQHVEEKYSVTIQDDSNSILKELIASDSGDTVEPESCSGSELESCSDVEDN